MSIVMKDFTDIVGQDSIKEYFQNVIAQEKLSHAYILKGEQSSGKEFVSKIIAMTLQCSNRQNIDNMIQPCGNCPSCIQTMTMNQPDIIYVTLSDGKKSIGVSEIRKQVNDDVYIKPYKSKYKIYVITDADKMTKEAQNSILKTLEEPPAYAILILLVTNIEVLFETILSRCVILPMQPVREDELKKYLLEVVQIPSNRVNLCIAFARGNLGRAKQLAEQEDFEKMQKETLLLLKNVKQMDLFQVMSSLDNINEYKMGVNDFLDLIAIWYRDVLLFKATNDMNHLIFKEEIQQIKNVANTSDYEGLERVLDAVEITKKRLRANVKQELAIELLMLTIKEN